MAKALEHAVNFKLVNEDSKINTKEIKKQINMAKIHKARTVRAQKNIVENEKLMTGFGGTYTHAEKNMLEDIHPGVFRCLNH